MQRHTTGVFIYRVLHIFTSPRCLAIILYEMFIWTWSVASDIGDR